MGLLYARGHSRCFSQTWRPANGGLNSRPRVWQWPLWPSFIQQRHQRHQWHRFLQVCIEYGWKSNKADTLAIPSLPENIWEVHAISLLYEDLHFDRDFGIWESENSRQYFLSKTDLEKNAFWKDLELICYLMTRVFFSDQAIL